MLRQSVRSFSTKPFRVLGVQQIAVGGLSKERLGALWCDVLGATRTGTYRAEKENVDEDILRIGPGAAAIEIDIMQPIDPERSPKVHSPALNHVGLWVDNLHAAVEWLDNKGVRFTPGGIRAGAAGFDVTFIHPKGNEQKPLCGEGVLIELVQAPQAAIDAFKVIEQHAPAISEE